MPKPKSNTIQIRVSHEVAHQLRVLAARWGITRKQAADKIISEAYEKHK